MQEASFQNPRAIVFGPDAKFILTFNGDPSQWMFNSLEILQFVDSTNEFELYQIDFPIQGRLARPQKNPAACMSCHSADAESAYPIWGRYPFWRGSYGANDDLLLGEEAKQFQLFQTQWDQHPRYKQLIRQAGSPVSPYSTDEVQTVTFRPNSNLGSFLARLNAKQVASQIQRTPHFEKYLLLISPSFFNCGEKLALAKKINLNMRLLPDFNRAGFLSVPHAELATYETANLAYLLGSSAFAWGQISYGKLTEYGQVVRQDRIFDPYFLDGYFMTTPNYILGQLAGNFFAKYPQLKSHYEPWSRKQTLGSDSRLVRTEKDRQIISQFDEMGIPLYLKNADCGSVLEAVEKEFLQ